MDAMAEDEFKLTAEKVIAELCALCPSTSIRDVIRLYCPDKTTKQLTMAFNQVNQPLLIETLDYLNMPNRSEYVKNANVEAVILRIQNLLPEVCGICKCTYITKNSDVNLLSCTLCGQEAHQSCLLNLLKTADDQLTQISKDDVQRLINPCNIPGFHYFCHTCNTKALGNEKDGLKKSVKRKGNATSPTFSTQVTLPIATDVSPLSSEVNNNLSVLNADKTPVSENAEKNRSNLVEKKNAICKFYAKGCNCKHGMSGKRDGECLFLHPKVCKKVLFKGKCTSKECKKYHPKMCYNSLNSGKCFKENCGYWHPKKTLRDPPVIPADRFKHAHNEDSINADNYQHTPVVGSASKTNSEEMHFLDSVRIIKEEMAVWQQSILLHINTVMNKFQSNLLNHQPLMMNQGAHCSQSQWNPPPQVLQMQSANHPLNSQGGMA